MSDTIIRVENLGKKYLIKHQKQGSYTALRDVITDKVKSLGKKILSPWNHKQSSTYSTTEEFWALKDISFKVKQGEVVGIIGRNGAGKSTLLKIISRITEPTKGRIRINGRVASLLEVGTGFHPELTGRENIFLNGAILGMTRQEMKKKFDEIIAFSEIEKFLDTPVKRYSSGMYVRLAFAVAAHLDPEILLVDEVLAVGDAAFQKKCLGKMEAVGKEGRTVLVVSHNMGTIYSLTRKCVYLEKGELLSYSDTASTVGKYLTDSFIISEDKTHNLDFYRPDYVIKAYKNERKAHYTDIWVEHDKQKTTVLEMGEPFALFFELEVANEITGANLSVTILNSEFRPVTVIFSWDNDYYLNLSPGRHVIRLVIEDLILTPGKYYINTGINQSTESVAWDGISNLPLFEVRNSGKIVHFLHRQWGGVHWDTVHWHLESLMKDEVSGVHQ
ncbi:MAG: ABC transporter ATP-binding protein [Deltaproteobacteria bacterium]|nr:ABC transporter ATP-binding protein [Deltaproteobacteria bacterium]